MTNNSFASRTTRRFDRAGSLRPAAMLFVGLSAAATIEALLALRQSRLLCLVFLGLGLGWAVLALDLIGGDERRPVRSRALLVAMLLVLLLATKRLLFGDSGTEAWPTLGLLLVVVATAIVIMSTRYGLSWYGGRALFVVCGAIAAFELGANIALRSEETGVMLANLVRLGVVAALGYVAVEEGQLLYRSWALFRRRMGPPTGSLG